MAFKADNMSVGDGDGDGDYGFMFLNLRIVEGRDPAVVKETGDCLLAAIKEHIEPVFGKSPMGITLNIEETPKQLPGPDRIGLRRVPQRPARDIWQVGRPPAAGI